MNSPNSTPSVDAGARELIDNYRFVLTMYIELYKHHFDLWLKAQALYVAIEGTAAGLIFRTELAIRARMAICLFACICSVFAVLGGIITRRWLFGMEGAISRASALLGLEALSLKLAKQTVAFAQAMASVFFICGLILSLQLRW
jgi:hypothetical protein